MVGVWANPDPWHYWYPAPIQDSTTGDPFLMVTPEHIDMPKHGWTTKKKQTNKITKTWVGTWVGTTQNLQFSSFHHPSRGHPNTPPEVVLTHHAHVQRSWEQKKRFWWKSVGNRFAWAEDKLRPCFFWDAICWFESFLSKFSAAKFNTEHQNEGLEDVFSF